MSQAPTVQWGLRPFIDAVSSLYTNELRLAGFPDISGGRIGYGSRALDTRIAPPSCSCTWESGGALGMDYGLDGNATPVQPVLNSLATELLRLDFHIWGCVSPPDSEGFGDADACRFMVHMLWRVIHRCAEGQYRVVSVDPQDQPATSVGARAIFRVEFRTPVLDNLIQYVPGGTVGAMTVGATALEPAATFNVGSVT